MVDALACSLVLGLAAAPTTSATPKNPISITMYHVNPGNYTGITNMDTADAAGDAFFDLRNVLTHYECANQSQPSPPSPPPHHHHHHGGECSNPEEFADDLVISRVTVKADRTFGGYGECNVCENSSLPFTDPPRACTDGEYGCRCGSLFGPDEPCSPNVGMEKVATLFGSFPTQGSSYMTLTKNLANRTQGTWYSMFAEGECGHPKAKSCMWELVETVKKVNATCHGDHLAKSLETKGKGCFAGCPQPLNTTDACYVDCYYGTMLGPDGGTTFPAKGGMSGPAIVKLWTDAFDRCPGI